MRASVVIRSRDEAPRLRLALASLEGQAGLAEVIVVDDGSTDDTPAVLAEAAVRLPLHAIRNAHAEGRSAASNRGAAAATGALLIFLDGDTLAAPGMVAAHLARHRAAGRIVGRGETWHLRCTRFLADPETGRPQPDHAARVAALSQRERDDARVTVAQVRGDFAAVARRGAPGIYPGIAPERLHAAEMQALRERPDAALLWAAASGSNLSIARAAFAAAGGFDPAIDLNEHRELAYRLMGQGYRLSAVPDARTYHLTHRSGWRDPLRDVGWEQRFRQRHPEAPLTRLKAIWRAIGAGEPCADPFG